MVVDLFAHDGWVPLACLQLHIENHSIACGPVAHTEIEHKFTKERVSSIIFVPVCVCLRHIPGWIIIWKFVKEVLLHDFFGRAKTKQLNIAGFPDFTAALADLAKVHTDSSRPDYEYLVTVPVGADLIVLEGLMSKFQNSVFAGDFSVILKKHDEEFNKQRRRATTADAQSEIESNKRKREANTPRKLSKAYEEVADFREKHKQLLV